MGLEHFTKGQLIEELIRRLHAASTPLRVDEGGAVRVQNPLPKGMPDPGILARAAAHDRIPITNDRNTMIGFALQRVRASERMPGLIVTTNQQSFGLAIDDILLVSECMSEDEMSEQLVVF